MKEILEFLYYRYYIFQVKIGNADIAPFTAILILVFIFMLYFFDLLFLISIIFPNKAPNINAPLTCLVLFCLTAYLYYRLVYDGKYKKIIKAQEKTSQKKSGTLIILLSLVPFIILIISMIIKINQNLGNI